MVRANEGRNECAEKEVRLMVSGEKSVMPLLFATVRFDDLVHAWRARLQVAPVVCPRHCTLDQVPPIRLPKTGCAHSNLRIMW